MVAGNYLMPVNPTVMLTYGEGYYTFTDMLKTGIVPAIALVLLMALWMPFIVASWASNANRAVTQANEQAPGTGGLFVVQIVRAAGRGHVAGDCTCKPRPHAIHSCTPPVAGRFAQPLRAGSLRQIPRAQRLLLLGSDV